MQSSIAFGTAQSGRPVHLHLLRNAGGMVVGVSDLGASLVMCHVPDGRGSFPDVTLGHSGAAGYDGDGTFLGAIVGRCANRIAGARFELAGTSHRLAANNGANNLHSGPHTWSERLWEVTEEEDDGIVLELTSREGDQGFPGSVRARVSYRLSDDNRLAVHLSAQPSRPTIVNMVSHAYWNLNGHAAGSVLDHTLQIHASSYTPLVGQIPTGVVEPVEGTPYDFRTARKIGDFIEELPKGYDDNFCLENEGKVTQVARLVGEKTGITMTVSTDAPGLHVFAADHLNVPAGKGGIDYGPFAGVALEAQYYPDAIHHKNFAQPVFTPMRPFVQKTIFSFGTLTTTKRK